jgi:DNA-directed RNA polymerase specialized sigma24 family protein
MEPAVGIRVNSEGAETTFRTFVESTEPRLRRAFTAAYGPERGAEATSESLAYAWEHWDKVKSLENPAGLLFRVGQSKTRERKVRHIFQRPWTPEYWVDPSLGAALSKLTKSERVAVALVLATGLTPTEAAEVMGVTPSTVKTLTQRGLSKLRRTLGANRD